MLIADLRAQLVRECEEKARECEERKVLEEKFVSFKAQYGKILDRADSAELVLRFYEEQLRNLNPSFKPIDLERFQGWVSQSRIGTQDCLEAESIDTPKCSKSPSFRVGVARMARLFSRLHSKQPKEKANARFDTEWISQQDFNNIQQLTDVTAMSAGNEMDSSSSSGRRARWEFRSDDYE